jgi:hypothetical protein
VNTPARNDVMIRHPAEPRYLLLLPGQIWGSRSRASTPKIRRGARRTELTRGN